MNYIFVIALKNIALRLSAKQAVALKAAFEFNPALPQKAGSFRPEANDDACPFV